MRIHFIAIGGAVMHNLALTLHQNGHRITGSDDEIYNPSRDRLAQYGLLPNEMGWHPDRIHPDLDAIILGMHARSDNPELQKAQAVGLTIYSYPEYIYQHAKAKQRLVVAGSHGKTTTTSMIMHVLKYHQVDFDYLVGAQIEGFDLMARLSNAPLIVMEGDEYLSSPIDRRPKILHYHPHITIITGIAWDHINVFPTFEGYVEQFELYVQSIQAGGHLFYYGADQNLNLIVERLDAPSFQVMPYEAFESQLDNDQTILLHKEFRVPLQVFGQHNLANLKAAYLACQAVGISDQQFFEAITSFKGAAKRLQLLKKGTHFTAYLDFAHAPSKVQATIQAFKSQYPNRTLVACLELHTFSSLNKAFLPEYAKTMQAADQALVFFSEHTLAMKRLPAMSKAEVKTAFDHPELEVYTDTAAFQAHLKSIRWKNKNLLLMSSGTFGGVDYQAFVEELMIEF